MPISTRTIPPVVASAPHYLEKKYQQLKSLLDKGQREQVIYELKLFILNISVLQIHYQIVIGIDIQKELRILYHHQDSSYSATAQITNENSFAL